MTVDADGLTIYEGRVESLLATQEKKKNLMAGSPVYEILERVASHIVPLNLLDPDSPEFHPKSASHSTTSHAFATKNPFTKCSTSAKNTHFSERSSKHWFATCRCSGGSSI